MLRRTLAATASVLAGVLVLGASYTAARSTAPAAGSIKVVFVKGEQFFPVTRPLRAGTPRETQAMAALLAGPNAAERAKHVETALPAGTTLDSLTVAQGTATVVLSHTRSGTSAFDASTRPGRAAQIVYTLTAIPGITHVVIQVSDQDLADFEGAALAKVGALDQSDLARPSSFSKERAGVPVGPAPADPAAVQRQLVALHYLPANGVTGSWDYLTSQAVLAFQSWQGLQRDGTVGPQTLGALKTAVAPKPAKAGTGRRIEVYRSKGVTLLIDGSQVTLAVHSSSGAPGYETPAGDYSVFRKELKSWSYPYQVWLPYASYFNRGIAFHEYADVPATPASHGCVRLPAPEAPTVYAFATVGTRVSVF